MKQYIELVQRIKAEGTIKSDRTGTGTLSIFGHEMRFKMSDGFPLLVLKKTHTKSIIHELLWFLQGGTNTKYLNDNGVTIWDEWAKPDGELGPVYGKQWIDWNSSVAEFEGLAGIDQITNLINDIKTNPDSRRLMVSAWNVAEIDKMALPPCHYGFQVYTRELSNIEREKIFYNKFGYDSVNMEGNDLSSIPHRAISLMWNQRSVDTFLGIPFNIASYGLLLHMIAQCVNMVSDELIGHFGDAHLYLNHMEQVDELLKRWGTLSVDTDGNKIEPKLPTLRLNQNIKDIFAFKYEDINIDGYNPMPTIKATIAV